MGSNFSSTNVTSEERNRKRIEESHRFIVRWNRKSPLFYNCTALAEFRPFQMSSTPLELMDFFFHAVRASVSADDDQNYDMLTFVDFQP
jgi:hypothetical protein